MSFAFHFLKTKRAVLQKNDKTMCLNQFHPAVERMCFRSNAMEAGRNMVQAYCKEY